MPASISCGMDLPTFPGSFGWPAASIADDESLPESNSCITTSFQDHPIQYNSQIQAPLIAGRPATTEYSVPPLMDYSNINLLPYDIQSDQMINFPYDQLMKNMNCQDFLQDQEITSSSDLCIYQSLLQDLLDSSTTDHRPASYGTPTQHQEPASLMVYQRLPVEISSSGSTLWNPTEAVSGFYQSSTPPIDHQIQNEISNSKHSSLEARDQTDEPALKKPRIMAPSPLPTFKVRKEKLGDRITALQQLVSPFGKTDTASVLQESIDYIKFLHDQIRGLSAPYLKNGHQVQQSLEKANGCEGLDLASRGLCVAPISSTFGIASEAPVDFWASMFGGRYC